MSEALPWSPRPDGLSLTVRLTPKGGRDAIEGVEALADGRAVLKVRVRAAPVDGAANDGLVRLIAATLGIAPRCVRLEGGATARVKRLHLDGDTVILAAALSAIAGLPTAADGRTAAVTNTRRGRSA